MSTWVAALCVAPRSAYSTIPDVDCYTAARGAQTFAGGYPVVAHPPCRSWSRHTRHQAHPEPGERELGLWCVAAVAANGGILEQPAGSLLWEAAGLPVPSSAGSPLFYSLAVWQAWWGYPMRKATWLLLVGIPRSKVHVPLRLHPRGQDWRTEQLMSHRQRSATCPDFASWLVALAREARL